MVAETGDAKARVARGGWHSQMPDDDSPGPATQASASAGRSPEISRQMQREMAGYRPLVLREMDAPTLADVLAARRRIRPHLDPSPLRNYPSIDRLVGAEVWVKHENLLPTGAFKVRGGVNLMSQLDAPTRARGASGACIAGKSIRPELEVIGVQSAQAPTAHDSWREGKLVERPMQTVAEGLATRTAFELPQRIIRERLDDFVLVSDDELLAAVAVMIEKTRTLVEPAGAAALAAALSPQTRGGIKGRKVALICSGANISPAQLREVAGAGALIR